jgi:xylulokinase
MSIVLAVDAGTTTMKMAVVQDGRITLASADRAYPMNVNPGGCYDLNTEHWWNAFLSCCESLNRHLADVQCIGFSVSTPGATALGKNGEALSPAVLFLDGRSGEQAQTIRDTIGETTLLEQTSNLPVSGGCTASTILWWKEHHPELFDSAHIFGHTNTWFGKRLTGNWGMDPSTASLTALYNTTANDGQWNEDICAALRIPIHKLPPIIPSWEPVGELRPDIAARTGLPTGIPVLMGGNDAMCAALQGGVTQEGAILDVCGTCEIICIGLSKSIPGAGYNIRCHVIPGLWSTLYVLNTGGKALEWFHHVFCRDMTETAFYDQYVPDTISRYMESNWELPSYEVYLAGDRYSTQKKYASFASLSLETDRDRMLMALIRGNTEYLNRHLIEMRHHISLSKQIHLTGGGISDAFIQCKKRWMGDYDFIRKDNSSVLGAAQLAHYHSTGEKIWDS